jgi:acetyltransferase-like isoleucine patch superfamily enzyme
MSLITKVRRGKGPFWGGLKRLAKAVLTMHMPTGGPLKPFWRAMYSLHVFIRESWIWFRRFFWNEPLFRSYCESVGVRFEMEELPYIQGCGRIVIGDCVCLSGKSDFSFNNRHSDAPLLSIGDGTFVGHQCSLIVGKSIHIGRHCLLAAGVSISDYDGHPLDAEARRRGETSPASEIRPVIIGDDVWIGGGAAVLKGVTIGDRAIVGACSVVTKDVPPDTVVAGNPARVVKNLVAAELSELARCGVDR